MILSNLNGNVSCITSMSCVSCDMIMFASRQKLFHLHRETPRLSPTTPSSFCSLIPSIPSFSLPLYTHTHIFALPPSLSDTHFRTRTRACARTNRARRAYGYFSPLWRLALKLWHPYRLALRWARFARALRLSVALFQTERERGGLTHPSLTHNLTVSYTLMKHTHAHTHTGVRTQTGKMRWAYTVNPDT